MYSYITKELPLVISSNFPSLDLSRLGITGHSMGGHGALSIAIKNQDLFKSVSAFAPICNPINCPWGVKAFSNYLGSDKKSWDEYDSSELLLKYGKTKYDKILIDLGLADNFYKQNQLLPEAFRSSAAKVNQNIELNMREGYDHGYYFISTFIENHIKFHKDRL